MILLVENDPLLGETVYQLLEMHGYAVSVATDGKEAMAQMTWQTPELIISDWHMPNMNGMDLCRLLRHSVEFASVPIIMMSGMEPRRDITPPFDLFLLKPFRLANLLDAVRELTHTDPQLQRPGGGDESERV
jgi:DNA-binding response OmpR family regulator